MENEGKCAHKACFCPVDDDSDYCSPQCESAAAEDVAAIDCDCGHAACQ